jgi:hypothetical protein
MVASSCMSIYIVLLRLLILLLYSIIMFLRMDIGSLDYILKTSTKMDAMCDLTSYWDEHKQ